MILKIFVSAGAVFIAFLAIMNTATDARMYAGLTFAFLLLVCGNAPLVFKKIAISLANKFCTIKEEPDDVRENKTADKPEN